MMQDNRGQGDMAEMLLFRDRLQGENQVQGRLARYSPHMAEQLRTKSSSKEQRNSHAKASNYALYGTTIGQKKKRGPEKEQRHRDNDKT